MKRDVQAAKPFAGIDGTIATTYINGFAAVPEKNAE
jgi:hypothetical protein